MKPALISLLLFLSPWHGSSFQAPGDITSKRKVYSHCLYAVHPDSSKDAYRVEITLDGKTSMISVRPGESILNALERNSGMEFSVSFVPHDCRRGNCLTCAGRHLDHSVASNLMQNEDGLSPEVSEALFQDGKGNYVLTCSSYVTGEGVKLELGANNLAWDEVYRNRLQSEDVERISLAASAKVMRMAAERNVEKWKQKMETVIQLDVSKGDQ